MQIDDIEVGEEYAVRVQSWAQHVRVRVLSVDPEKDRIKQRAGGGISGGISWPTGRERRCVRVMVVKGHYRPYGAYGASDIAEGATGLVVPVHFRYLWAEQEENARRNRERREEHEHAKAEAERRCEAMRPKLEAFSSKAEIKLSYGDFDGFVEIDIGTLEQLVAQAER